MNTPHITAFALPGAPRFYLCLAPSWHPPTDLTWVYLMLSSYPKYAPPSQRPWLLDCACL